MLLIGVIARGNATLNSAKKAIKVKMLHDTMSTRNKGVSTIERNATEKISRGRKLAEGATE